MEPRKVQQVGKSTLTVSLPSGWTEKYGINKGDHVYLSDSQMGSITVFPSMSGSSPLSKAVIDADGKQPITLERAVVGSYVLGRKEIVVESETGLTDERIDALYNAEAQLMGAGIIEESPKRTVVRCSINPDEFSVRELLSRLNSTATTMREDAVKSLVEGDSELAKRGERREGHANKVFVLLLRLLLSAQQNPVLVDKIGLENSLHIVGARAAAKSLERCADHAADMSKDAESMIDEGWTPDGSVLEKLERLAELTDSVCITSLESLEEGDLEAASKTRNEFEKVKQTEEDVMSEVFGSDLNAGVLLRFKDFVSSLTQSSKEAVEIAEIGSNRALEVSSEKQGIRLEK